MLDSPGILIKETAESEWFNIDWVTYKNSKLIQFEWREYIVSNKAILTIQVTEACNANCGFCFNGITFYPRWNFSKEHESSLDQVLAFCHVAGIKTVTLSWWEPTLHLWKLQEIVEKIKWKFSEYRIHTNGFNLMKRLSESNEILVIDYLINAGFNRITLSLAHHESTNNQELMKFRGKFIWLNEADFIELWKRNKKWLSVRFSCFLSHEGIHTVEGIEEYIEVAKKFGIKNVIFRTAWNTPIEFLKDTSYAQYGAGKNISIDALVVEMKWRWYKEKFELHKSDIHVHVLEVDGMTIDFEESSEEVDPDKKVRRVNFFWNGITYKSWIDPTEVLFENDRDTIIRNIIQGETIKLNGAYPASALGQAVQSRIAVTLGDTENLPADFHLHTINSDWEHTIDELFKIIKSAWLRAFTVTEHNFISEEEYLWIQEKARENDIEVAFPGVEINVVTNPHGNPERKHHLLAYGSGLFDSQFQELIWVPNRLKLAYYEEVIDRLNVLYGFNLPNAEEIMRWVQSDGTYRTPNKKMITRNAIVPYISDITWESHESIKSKYLPKVPEDVSYAHYNRAEDIIPIIKELWGISWLAHPGWSRPFTSWWSWKQETDYSYLLNEIWRLRKLWMDWIEIHHKSHPKKTIEILSRFRSELMLLALGWSDYHGPTKMKPGYKNILPWTNGLTWQEYERIKERLL